MSLIITDVSHRHQDFDLSPQAQNLLWRMEEKHFWHRARNLWIAKALRSAGLRPPARILEVGCGSGAVTIFLHGLGYRVTGIDTSEALVRKAHDRCDQVTFILGDVKELRAPIAFDAVCFFDVLEHLSDPLGMVRACRSHGVAGGIVAATVPAQRSLHTVIDELSGHKLRYETGQLARLLGCADLTDIHERGIFRAVAPFQKLARRHAKRPQSERLGPTEKDALWAANFRIPPSPINFGLELLCSLECSLGFAFAENRPGASLLATGRWP